jgi:D-3-phosphoglycerate dehydrogenase
MSDQPRFKIWFERAIPSRYAPMLDGVATAASDPSEADGIVAGSRVAYNADFFQKAPALRVVSRTGIGYDNIRVLDATAHRIAICNAPDGPTISTAEHTIALIFAVTKKLKQCARDLTSPEKQDFFNNFEGVELAGKTLGLVGYGRIGRRVASIAKAVGMRVIVYDPFIQGDQVERSASLDELLAIADVVSIHAPLTDETRHLINAGKLKSMKRGSILINCARGGIVDETALLESLESGHLLGAGLDVFEKEPPSPDHPLLSRVDVVATPHIASATDSGKDRLWTTAIAQVLQVLRGERPPHLINPEVWDHMKRPSAHA